MKVLITGCNRHSKALVRSLKNNRDRRLVEVIGINNNPDEILRTEVDEAIVAPPVTDPKYVDWLLDLCTSKKVDVVLPFVTAELPVLALNREKLESTGTKISVSSYRSVVIANDKERMGQRFSSIMPRQTLAHSANDVIRFAKKIGYYTGTPMCCKLTGRSGGTGFAIIDDKRCLDITIFNKAGVNRYISFEQLCEIVEKVDADILLQEYIEGPDYSVCVLADNGQANLMCGLIGYAMEFGAYMRGEILKNDKAYEITKKLVKDLGLDGNACFDFVLRADGTPVLLECNPRINAGIPFLEAAGADLAYLRCKQLLGEPVPDELNIKYGLKMVKYYETYFYQ